MLRNRFSRRTHLQCSNGVAQLREIHYIVRKSTQYDVISSEQRDFREKASKPIKPPHKRNFDERKYTFIWTETSLVEN